MRRRAVIALGVLAVTAIASSLTASVQATAPGKDGSIAFSRYRFREDTLWAEIFVSKVDGTSERRVTHARKSFQDLEPDWSPDGSRIVFTRCGAMAPCSIWSGKADGSGAKRLSPYCPPGGRTPKCVDDSSPAYSPNGRSIAFVRFRRGPGQLTVADAELRHPRKVALVKGVLAEAPAWSPSGRQLTFAGAHDPAADLKPRNGRAIYVVGADGTGLRRVTPWRLKAGDHPDWSPDGTSILFRTIADDHGDFRQGNLYTVRPDGTRLRQLTHFPSSVRVLQTGSYSPDGASIIFATTAGATKGLGLLPDVFVMRADGTDIRPVTRSRNWDGSPDWGPETRGRKESGGSK
jgi:Tol biopolymer transport system component